MRRLGVRIGVLASVAALGGGCALTPDEAPVAIRVWAHAGTDEEQQTLREQVADFNSLQNGIRVRLRLIPEGDHHDELAIAAAGRRLPDVVELDGPVVPAQVEAGRLVPLDGLLPDAVLDDQLPSLRAQGRYDGATYAVGTFDSGLGLYADREAFERAGIALPARTADAWTAAEFTEVLRTLARDDKDGRVLDLKRNYGLGEWLTYGFSPLVASAGGALVDPGTGEATGHLDGPVTLQVLRRLRSWAPYVDDNPADRAFTSRRVALSWVGHWAYPDYHDALGDDLAIVPLPDLGQGTKTGQGSWTWGVTAGDEEKHEAAATFLEYLLTDDQVLRITNANGAVPGTTTALQGSELYDEGGPLRLYVEQLLDSCADRVPGPDCVAVPRPRTPVYPILSVEFAGLVDAALRGRVDPHAAAESARIVDEELALTRG